ncbi:glucokinase [Methylophaga lonarensis MPL]|uniref:Glucokinase n=1 Tax=Methylophaga lonarensis MPL TaxID=1286106 RepID=M7NXP0_9GAMM|nr:glucokinase [Methylophaga lonarensis]EMR11956.1 glucokinase [Methylophaga lonarensis MPL]
MSKLLAADLGGTKALFSLIDEQGLRLEQKRYESALFDNFESLLEHFLKDIGLLGETFSAACFAVAGPVQQGHASITNLPWQIDAAALSGQFAIGKLRLVNDFAALAHCIPSLVEDELLCLQAAEMQATEPKLVIGAGTGLGQALLIADADGWRVLATEGGHMDFAPNDLLQDRLLTRLRERFGHVSVERLLSGSGLVTLYNFLRDYEQHEEDPALRQAMTEGDPAAAISRFARQENSLLARKTLDVFVSLFGAQAGNAALACLPRGGVYLAGGIAAKNADAFVGSHFLEAFSAKGRMRGLMQQFPVNLVLAQDCGLRGAEQLAVKALYN